MINFKDSDRESLLSYIQSAAVLVPDPAIPMIDTPTRLVNESNEFLEMHLVKKRKASMAPRIEKSPKIESTASS